MLAILGVYFSLMFIVLLVVVIVMMAEAVAHVRSLHEQLELWSKKMPLDIAVRSRRKRRSISSSSTDTT